MIRIRPAALLVLLLSVQAAFGQQHPNQKKGFDPAGVYQFDSIDNVNLFNGNLIVTIPLGQTYKIDGGLSYGLTAVYNGNVWDYGLDVSRLTAYPHRRGNAGMGWIVSLGRLFWVDDAMNRTPNFSIANSRAFVYEAPDGSDHEFEPDVKLETDTYITTVDHTTGGSGVMYRMSKIGTAGVERLIETPDGRMQTFRWMNPPPQGQPITEVQDWRLVKIADRFGNHVDIRYDFPANPNHWTIDDGIRQQELQFEYVPDSTLPQLVLKTVKLAAFGTQIGEYLFDYATVSVPRPANDQSAANRGPGPAYNVALLQSITFPSGEKYTMQYDTSTVAKGLLTTLGLPTRGRIEYKWADLAFSQLSARIGPREHPEIDELLPPEIAMPVDGEEDPDTDPPIELFPSTIGQTIVQARAHAIGIAERTFYEQGEASGSVTGRKWTYIHKLGRREDCNTEVEGVGRSVIGDRYQKAVIVTSPAGLTTIHYFSLYRDDTICEAHDPAWRGIEYGCPVSHYRSVASTLRLGEGLYPDDYPARGISTETISGPITLQSMSPANAWRPVVLDEHTVLKRSTWVAYGDLVHQKTEGVIRSVVDEDTSCVGVPCFTEEVRLNWDNLAHFKQVGTNTNYPGSKFRISFTNFSGLPPSGEWVLDTYTEQCVRDFAEFPPVYSGCAAMMNGSKAVDGQRAEFCFDRTNGFLKRKRVFKTPAERSTADVISQFLMQAGNVTREEAYGGDLQTVSTDGLCDISQSSLGIPWYGTAYTYSYGSVQSAAPLISPSHPDSQKSGTAPFVAFTNVIDPHTGFVAFSTDVSQVQTRSDYDTSGRLVSTGVVSSPTEYVGYPTTYDYAKATASARAKVTVQQGPSATGIRQEYEFDDFGRLVRESRTMPDETPTRETMYDAAGRKWKIRDFGAPADKLTIFSYDIFDRVLTQTAPDGSVTTFDYVGTRETHRTSSVETVNGSQPAVSNEEYDLFGRLAKVSGPTRKTAESTPELTAQYQYDIADRLIGVAMYLGTQSEATQTRKFDYDGRGFLALEEHPESGKTFYGRYDARGHAEEKRQGDGNDSTYDLKMTFDAAERMTHVFERSAHGSATFHPLKDFVFGTDNPSSQGKVDHRKGKLQSAVRYNYEVGNGLGGDVQVTTAYKYEDGQGRISSKETAVQSGPTFKQDFTYDELGQPTHVRFPTCVGCGNVNAPGDRSLALQWKNGYLQSMQNFVSGITYWGNGMIHQLTHQLSGQAHGTNGLTDTIAIATDAMPRPLSISVDGLCTGPQITGTITGSTEAFAGDKAHLTAPAGGDHYEWFDASTGQSLGVTSSPADIVVNGPRDVFVRVYDAKNCYTDSADYHIGLRVCNLLQLNSFTADHELVAPGGLVTFTANVGAPSDATVQYVWTPSVLNENGKFVEAEGVTTNESTRTLTLAASTQMEVVAQSGSDCKTAPQFVNVHVCELPKVVVQPQSAWAPSPANGQTVTLTASVAAKGDSVKYQWYRMIDSDKTHAEALAGQTTETLTRIYGGNVAERFFCHVYDDTNAINGCRGADDSELIDFVVSDCAKLTLEPGSLYIYQNAAPMLLPVEVNVGASSGTIRYTWYATVSGSGSPQVVRDTQDQPFTGAGGHRDFLTVLSNSPIKTYWCVVKVVTGSCSTTLTSRRGTIAHWGSCPLPPVSIAPKSALVYLNGTTNFVVACDWPKVTYQWYLGESGDTHRPLAGATTNKFHADSTVQSYWCRVTDECGINHRDTETVTVARRGTSNCYPPFIARQPESVVVAAGQRPLLTIEASGASQLQWWELGGLQVGTGPEFLAPSATKTYFVKLITACETGGDPMESALVTVRVGSCPSITIADADKARLDRTGSTPVLRVHATATGSITYTWYEGLPGDVSHAVGTGEAVSVNPSATTNYWVRIATSQCTVDSAAVVASVCGIPVITQQPFPGSIAVGQGYLLEAKAAGTGLTYKWHSGSSTGPVISTNPGVWVYPTDTSIYVFEAIDSCGTSVFSNPVTVLACVAPGYETSPSVVGLGRVFSGKTASITARATEAKQVPITYRLLDALGTPIGNPVPGPVDGSAVTLTTPAITEETQFTVRASAGVCDVDSQPVTVHLCSQSELVGIATEQQVAIGDTVHLSTGSNDISDPQNTYAWYLSTTDGTTVTNVLKKTGNDNWYTFAAENPGASAVMKYWAQVTNLDGCVSHTPDYIVRVCKPAITAQPVGDMINSGENHTLSVEANTPGLTYQWFSGVDFASKTAISGATSSSVVVHPTTQTTYWVTVTGACGTGLFSSGATLTICQPPAISTVGVQGSIDIPRGETTGVGVTATGTNLTYQWYTGAKGVTTNPISGATNLTLPGLAPQDTTSYWVRVTGRCGSVDSDVVTINVCATPRIDTQPQPISVFSGNSATISVAATALTAVPITYQWYEGTSGDTGTPISGATSASYTTPALTQSHNYWVRIRSANCTAANSQTVTVSVCPYPQTVAGPANVQTSVAQQTRLTTISQAGDANTYRWYRVMPDNSSQLVSGPSSVNYVDVAPSTTRQYYATITTGSCVTTTTRTTVDVCVPTITKQPTPSSMSVLSGVGYDIAPIEVDMTVSYQWYRGTGVNAVLLTGETGAGLHFTTTANTTYWCRVTSSCGRTADSNVVTVTICTPPSITTQPANAAPMLAGGSKTLSVTATGTGLTYQWYIGDSGTTTQPISGATSSSLTRSSVSQSEKFWVKVTGTCGSVNSAAAWISVYPTITSDLQSFNVRSGSSAAYKIVATGSYLHYQWHYADGTSVSNNDTAYFTIPAISTITAATGAYCDVSSGTATVRSQTSTVDLCDGVNIGIGVSGSGSCRTLYATYDYASDNYAWYKGNPGDISNPVGTGVTVQVCPTGSMKYWLRVSTNVSGAGMCYSDSTAVTLP